MGDDGAETLPKASRDFCCRETRNRTVNRGDTGEKDFKKKKSKSLQDGLVHNYTYYTYGLLVVFLLCRGGGWFFSGSFINDWITFLLRCPNPKKPHGDVIEMDPKHLTPKKEVVQ